MNIKTFHLKFNKLGSKTELLAGLSDCGSTVYFQAPISIIKKTISALHSAGATSVTYPNGRVEWVTRTKVTENTSINISDESQMVKILWDKIVLTPDQIKNKLKYINFLKDYKS